MFYIVQCNGYCIIKLIEIQKYIKDVKNLKYGMVAFQRRGVVVQRNCHASLLHGNFFNSYGPDDVHKNDRNMQSKETYIKTLYNQV